MKTNKKSILRRLSSLLFILAIALHTDMIKSMVISGYVGIAEWDFSAFWNAVGIMAGMVLLNGLSVLGLLLDKRWGINLAVCTVAYTLIFFSYNYIPLINSLFAVTMQSTVMITCNVLLMLGLVSIRR